MSSFLHDMHQGNKDRNASDCRFNDYLFIDAVDPSSYHISIVIYSIVAVHHPHVKPIIERLYITTLTRNHTRSMKSFQSFEKFGGQGNLSTSLLYDTESTNLCTNLSRKKIAVCHKPVHDSIQSHHKMNMEEIPFFSTNGA